MTDIVEQPQDRVVSVQFSFKKNLGDYSSQDLQVYVQDRIPAESDDAFVAARLRELTDLAKLTVYAQQQIPVSVTDENIIVPDLAPVTEQQAANAVVGSLRQNVSGELEVLGSDKPGNFVVTDAMINWANEHGVRKAWFNLSKRPNGDPYLRDAAQGSKAPLFTVK